MDRHIPPKPRSGIGGYDVIVRLQRAGARLSKSAIRGDMSPGLAVSAPRTLEGSARDDR
jgi:hypothetical protein